MGHVSDSAAQLNAFYTVWNTFGSLPEEFDSSLFADLPSSFGKALQGNVYYPLRPELIESTYYQYRATKVRFSLSFLFFFVIFYHRIPPGFKQGKTSLIRLRQTAPLTVALQV